jgi:hypothetical protein
MITPDVRRIGYEGFRIVDGQGIYAQSGEVKSKKPEVRSKK